MFLFDIPPTEGSLNIAKTSLFVLFAYPPPLLGAGLYLIMIWAGFCEPLNVA